MEQALRDCISSKSLRETLATKNELAGVPIEETCEKGGWKKGSIMPKKVYSHAEPIRLASRGTKRALESVRPPTSNNAHLRLEQMALLLTAEDGKELRKKRAGIK